MKMKSNINYFGLLIIIIVGVVSGNLISNWITSKLAEEELKKASTELSKALTQQTNKTVSAAKKQSESAKIITTLDYAELAEQRKLDEKGIRLAKTCNEWKVAHKDMNTLTSERGMKKHCEEYQEYIRTGVLPPSY